MDLLPPPPLLTINSNELNTITNMKIMHANKKHDLHKSVLLQNTINKYNDNLQNFISKLDSQHIIIQPTYASKILCMYDCNVDLACQYIKYKLFKSDLYIRNHS